MKASLTQGDMLGLGLGLGLGLPPRHRTSQTLSHFIFPILSRYGTHHHEEYRVFSQERSRAAILSWHALAAILSWHALAAILSWHAPAAILSWHALAANKST
jgi:hypothetical protein